jgi:SHS2 domain-containing protein
MTYSYEFLPNIALADTAFRVKADTWSQLFVGASDALTSVMVDLKDLQRKRRIPIDLSAPTVGELLYDWLSELVYLKDAEAFLVRSANVDVLPGAFWQVRGELIGDTIEPARQKLGQDVKAVTYHLFDVNQKGPDFLAQVVLDI